MKVSNRTFSVALAMPLVIAASFMVMLLLTFFIAIPATGLSPLSFGVMRPILLTLFVSFVSSVLGLVAAFPVAYVFSRKKFPLKGVVESIIDIPIILPPLALGMLLLVFFSRGPGSLIDSYFVSIVFSLPGILFAQTMIAIAFSVRILRSAIDEIHPRFESVARTLGCTRFQAFTKVILPLSKYALLNAFLLSWARTFGEFGATVTIGGASERLQTLPVNLYFHISRSDLSSASSVMLIMLFTSVMVLAGIRYFALKTEGSGE